MAPFVLFSGVQAFKPTSAHLGVGITNGAVDFLNPLAGVETRSDRVNAISPGSSIPAAWDAMGEDGAGLL